MRLVRNRKISTKEIIEWINNWFEKEVKKNWVLFYQINYKIKFQKFPSCNRWILFMDFSIENKIFIKNAELISLTVDEITFKGLTCMLRWEDFYERIFLKLANDYCDWEGELWEKRQL